MPVGWLSVAMTKYLVVGVVAASAVGGTAAVVTASGPTVVERVVDGDTVDVTVDGRPGVRVRLLNVDTPETKDPNAPVECLGPQAAARLAELLPVGSEVTLEGDVEPTDSYGRTLAGVTNADGVLVNAEVAREGLGVPMLIEPSRRFYDEVVAAHQEAKSAAHGLYAPVVDCTIPAAVTGVEQQSAAYVGTPFTADQWDAAANRSEQVVGRATAVLAMFDGPRSGLVWTAFSRAEQDALRARVQAALDRSSRDAASSRAAAARMREAAAAQERASAQARRDAEARQQAEARAAAQAEAEYEADLAATRRRQAAADSSSSSSTGRSSSSGSSSSASSGSSAYPGYTGPRCYEPGGRTYRPC